MKWNESGFRPLLCTYRLNWARRTSWGWWDDWDDTVLQTQDSKFEPWRCEAEHATSRSRRLPTILTFTRGWGRNNFVSFKPPRPGTEPRTLAWKAAVLTTTLGPPPLMPEPTYNTFSFFPKLATYISHLTDTRLIAAVAQLRLSSHNLEIERGIHTRPKTPVANRICRRCQTTQVDDEIHFLMQCNTFELDRKTLLSEAGKYITNFNTQFDTEQFKSIMSSENHAIINALAKYIYVCFEKIVV